jgi:tripartite ATP-independent transporter DctM subunit
MNLLPVVFLFILFFAGVPVALALILCLIPYFLMDPYISATVIIQRMVANVEVPSMMAAPMFIIAGSIMSHSGVTSRLMNLADCFVGHLTGGLGHINILLSTLMGGISGSGAADAASDCKILVPEMEKRGYSKSYSGAVTAASAVITPIIPPGVGLVVFASICECSVGKLFCSGYIPGIMMCIGMMLWNTHWAKKHDIKKTREHMASGKEILHSLRESVWALVIPFVLILGLRCGAFNAIEGGGLIAAYSLIIGKFVYKELDFKDLPGIMMESVLSIGPVMLVLCGANVFSYYLSWERIPQAITALIANVNGSRIVFLLVMDVVMLILGMFLDGMACMMIVAPLLAPVATALGINMIQFGIVMCLCTAIGAITPPFGTYIFLVAGTIKVKTEQVVKELIPFIVICICVLVLISIFPDVTLVIPRLVYGSV